jgi:hypothetical protein
LDLFLDTGIFLGLDTKDVYHQDVNKFLSKYPNKTNKYYSAKVVKEELRGKRQQFTRQGWSEPEIRRVWQIIRTFLDKID